MSQTNNHPDSFYKYTSINTAKEILKNQKIRLSKVASFNDPLDCYIPYFNEDMINEVSDAMYKKYDISKLAIHNNISSINAKVSLKWSEYIKQLRVFCMTADKTENILMWSHYAECHRGVKLEFSTHKTLNSKKAVEVKYENHAESMEKLMKGVLDYTANDTKNIPLLMDDETMLQALTPLIYNKREEWSYEKEYRFIEIQQDNEELDVKFETSELKSITLGLITNREDKDELVRIIEQNYPDTEIRMVFDENGELSSDEYEDDFFKDTRKNVHFSHFNEQKA